MKLKIILLTMLMIFIIVGCSVEEPQEQDPGSVPGESPILPEMDQSLDLDNLPEVVATIDGQQITKEEINQLDLQNQQTYGFSLSLEETVNQLLSQRILMQIIDEKDYGFTSQDVEDFFIQNGFDVNELREEVEMMGMDYNQFLEDYIDELKFAQYLSEIENEIAVSEEEMREFYEEQKVLFEEELTYEDIEEDIYFYLVELKTNDYLMLEVGERLENSDVDFFY